MSALSDAATSLYNYAKTMDQMAKVIRAKADKLMAMDQTIGQLFSAPAPTVTAVVPTVPYVQPDLNPPVLTEVVQSVAAPTPQQGAIVTDIGGSTIETAMTKHTDQPS